MVFIGLYLGVDISLPKQISDSGDPEFKTSFVTFQMSSLSRPPQMLGNTGGASIIVNSNSTSSS